MKIDTIVCGDSAKVLASFPDACIDLTVTSPPYDNLRTYNGFVFDFETIAAQLYRVTKPGGVVVWVVGDATVNGSETGTSFKQALYFKEIGFNLHDTMIWRKVVPGYFDKRYNPAFEYMFILSRGNPRSWNPLMKKNISKRASGGHMGKNGYKWGKPILVKEFGILENIWNVLAGNNGDKHKGHPAPYPETLAHNHILSWSNPGDLVLDPFIGSGTTAKMAKETGRHFIGIDISEEYCKLAEKRVRGANVPLFTEMP